MNKKKNIVVPLIVTVLLILSICYLAINAKQPYIECSKKSVDEYGITIEEKMVANLEANRISSMQITKTIKLPEKYYAYLVDVEEATNRAYSYLDDGVKIVKNTDSIIVNIDIDRNQTVILNNMNSIVNDNNFKIDIDTNTKSSNVVTLSIKDKYTEGELMSRMKNYGYSCK